jgi:hypothetical protein
MLKELATHSMSTQIVQHVDFRSNHPELTGRGLIAHVAIRVADYQVLRMNTPVPPNNVHSQVK